MHGRRGITILEVVIALAMIVALIVWFCISTLSSRRTAARLKDAQTLKDIHRAMVVWSNNGVGEFPLPSRMDLFNHTIAAEDRAKNTTANIFSVLVFFGNLSPEQLISARETNPAISADGDYAYINPPAAVDPNNALWDPAFSADFTNGKTGNISFAHLQPGGRRVSMWQDTFAPDEAVLANRSPEITSVTITGAADDAANYTVATRSPRSLASAIHGTPTRWRGNVAFNDGRVDFVDTLGPLAPIGTMPPRQITLNATPANPRDVIFFDEPEDTDHFNLYLGIFITAGEKPSEFKGIWD